jgi:hypothetical protein
MANPRIIPKKSAISKVPSSSDLVSGEVAVNYADQQWYGKHPSTGAIVEIGAPYLHSHDQLLSLDKNNELELNNSGSLVLSVGANATTLTPTSTTSRTLTLPNKSGTLATLDDISGGLVSIDATASDLLSFSSGTLSADDLGSDKIFFWDDSAAKATGLTVGTGLSITGTTLNASALPIEIGLACSDETTPLTTGTAKVTFRMPCAMTLTAVRATLTTAPVGSTLIVDINDSGTSILSTKLSIDASEKTSTTAATAAVISDSSLADDAEITLDIDQVGSSTAGAGLKVWLIGTR